MAPSKRRRPPSRDTGNGLQKNERFAGGLGIETTLNPVLPQLIDAPSAIGREEIQTSILAHQTDWLMRRFRLTPSIAALVALLALGGEGSR
jgi:hypothetical protein